MAEVTLDNVQGDVFNRGFPKFNEAYYMFSIVQNKEKDFSQALKKLVLEKDKYISSLTKVLADWAEVDVAAEKNHAMADPNQKVVVPREIVPVSNALIAFTKRGLDKIQTGLTGNSLELKNLKLSDPAFDLGMAVDGPRNLNDPPPSKWDPLFNKVPIHGLLKVAGSCPEEVESKLNAIKSVLGHPTVIKDIAGQSPPTTVNSRLDGQVRPLKKRGFEHFGFQDGLSQPLLKGINSDATIENDKYMQTDQNIIIVSETPPGTQDGIKAEAKRRPNWMVGGTFLAFRKLEQDVQAWKALVDKYESAGCNSADHCGAKLMGRWPSGAPITLFPTEDTSDETTRYKNDFKFKSIAKHTCPLGAHIRKANPRTDADSVKMARMIRSGIPYGSEFTPETASEKRGLLFACYQSSLENSFQFVQKAWCNTATFPTSRTGYDALIGQTKTEEELLHTTLHGPDEEDMDPGLGKFQKMVKMRGGDYFFVPSISALRDKLGSD